MITEAGNHPKVAALVYIAGFVPDQGESVETLVGTFPPGEPNAGDAILPPQEGFLFLDREKFHEQFAGDLSADEAAFMADSQVPWGVEEAERHDQRGGMGRASRAGTSSQLKTG